MSKAKIYRKTATITAERFDGSDGMAKRYRLEDHGGHIVDRLHVDNTCFIRTLEGPMKVNYHDWIATGVDGEHWAISDEIFKKTYAELPVILKDVAALMENYRKRESLSSLLLDAANFYFENSILDWIKRHDEVIARAWLDGYQIEEEDK